MSENQTPQNPAPAADGGGVPSLEQRIATITSTEAYNRADHPEHAAHANMARLLYAQADREERGAPEPEQKDGDGELLDANDSTLEELPHIDELRRQAGVDAPTLPEAIRENWVESAESDFLAASVDAGLSKSQIGAILDRYTEELVVGGRGATGPREGDEQAWLDFLKSIQVPDAFARRLVRWARENSKQQ